MRWDIKSFVKRTYPFVFVLAFWGGSILPLCKTDINFTNLGNNFLGHDILITDFNTLRLRLGDRVFQGVLVGRQGSLFYTGSNSIDDYQHSNLFSLKELVRYRDSLDAINAELKQRGATFIVIIPPDKSTIYPGLMPGEIQVTGKTSRMGQFIDFMHTYGKTPIIDLRPDLIAASKTNQLYFKTDLHWNDLAWYITYSKMLSVLSQNYPELVAHPLSDYKDVYHGATTMQLPQIIALPDMMEDFYTLEPKFPTSVSSNEIPLMEYQGQRVRFTRNQNQSLPSILIFHDSFFLGVIPLLEPQFRQTTSVFRDSFPAIWNMNWINQQRPDIVILEFTEFYMNNMDMSIPRNQ